MSKKKKIIIITLIIVMLLAIAGVTAFVIINNQEKDKDKKSDLEWGDVYLEVLNDKEKIEDMDNMQIQLCDLDEDGIPELIMYGIKNMKQYLANIYKINEKNKIDTIKVSLDEKFDIKLAYNLNEEKYEWYAITDNKTNKKVYDLNIKNERYEAELLDINYENDIVELDIEENKKVDFNKDFDKKQIEDAFNSIKAECKTKEDMITDKVKEKVESALILKKVEKNDSNKAIVYSVVKSGNYEYPAINIKSDDVNKINLEIKEKYGFALSEVEELSYMEIEEISYEYAINGKILSVLVKHGGNSSVWADAYNVNIETGSKISVDDLIKEKGLDKSEIISKAQEATQKTYEETIKEDKKTVGAYWSDLYRASDEEEWKSDLKTYIQKLENIYINKDGDVCVLAKYQHPGGQWSCVKTIIVNVSKDYKTSELNLNKAKPTSAPATTATSEPSPTPKNKNPMTKITYDSNANNKIPEGVYKTDRGELTIKNSTNNSFEFQFEVTNGKEVPNFGTLEGTAKAIVGGNYAYEEHNTGSFQYDYNIFFYIAGGDSALSITVKDECSVEAFSPYCGNGVTFEGTYTK